MAAGAGVEAEAEVAGDALGRFFGVAAGFAGAFPELRAGDAVFRDGVGEDVVVRVAVAVAVVGDDEAAPCFFGLGVVTFEELGGVLRTDAFAPLADFGAEAADFVVAAAVDRLAAEVVREVRVFEAVFTDERGIWVKLLRHLRCPPARAPRTLRFG